MFQLVVPSVRIQGMGMSNISNAILLPDSIWLEIFSYIHRRQLLQLSPVSRKWYQLCHDKILWKHFSIKDFQDCKAENIEGFCRKFLLKRNLITLDLQDCYCLSNRSVMSIASNSSRMKVLNLGGCHQINDRAVSTVAAYCKNLTVVNLADLQNVTEIGLINLFSTNLALADVSVDSAALTEKALNSLCGCKSLNCLITNPRPYYFQNDSSSLFSSKMLLKLALSCQKLVMLVLKYDLINLNSVSLSILGYFCKRLECLELSHSLLISNIGDASLLYLCHQLKGMKSIDVSSTEATDLTLFAVSFGSKQIEHVGFKYSKNFTDFGVFSLLKNCSKIESLTLGTSNDGITNVSAFLLAHSACAKNLLQLTMHNWNIDNVAFIYLLSCLPKLLHFSVEDCTNVSKDGFFKALDHLQNLITLNISNAIYIECGEDLINLAKKLPALKRLVLHENCPISELYVKNFYEILPECCIQDHNV